MSLTPRVRRWTAAGTLYVTEGQHVLKLAAGASAPTVLPFPGLKSPEDVAVDTAGNLYVSRTGQPPVRGG